MNNNIASSQMRDPLFNAVRNRADRVRQILEPVKPPHVSATGNTYTTHSILPRGSFPLKDGELSVPLERVKDKLMLWRSLISQDKKIQFSVKVLEIVGYDIDMAAITEEKTITISAYNTYVSGAKAVVEFFENQRDNYEDDGYTPSQCEFLVSILHPVGAMVGMGAARSHKQATANWAEISPESFSNCLYHAVVMTRTPDNLGSYLADNAHIVNPAKQLKKRVNPTNKKFSDAETIQHVCDHIKTDIVIYDNLYIKHAHYKPVKYPHRGRKPALEIRYTNRNHFTALIRWGDVPTELHAGLKTPVIPEPEDTSENKLISKHKIRKAYFDKIGTWDIETWSDLKGLNHTYALGLGWMNGDKKEYRSFWGATSATEFFECLDDLSEELDGMYLYAHNGGKFDILNVMKVIMDSPTWRIDSQKHEMVDLDGRVISMCIYNKKGHFIHFRDSCAMLAGPLKKLCEDFQVGADTKGEEDHEVIADHINEHGLEGLTTKFPTLYEYLRCDVHGLLEIMLKFNRIVYDLTYVKAWKKSPAGGVTMVSCLTAASFAKKLFFQKYWFNNIYMLNDPQDQFIRSAYGGGRTEVFQMGETKRKLWYLDFTSLFPSVCDQCLPCGKPVYVPQFQDIKPYSFIRCMVRSTDLGMTKKPLHYIKRMGKMIFPHLGDWTEMTLYSAEMLYGKRKGLYEYELLDGYRFEGKKILKAYMNDGFKAKAVAKKEGKKALAQAHKIIINSGYGFWGLNKKNRDSVKIIDDPKFNPSYVHQYIEKGQLVNESAYNGYIQLRLKKDIPVSDFNVSVAAAITSLARVRITNLIHDIEDTGKRVFYCDTDSVITDCDVVNIPHLQEEYMWDRCGDDLGSLKNEADDEVSKERIAECGGSVWFDKLIVMGAKFYSLKAEGIDITKCKGRKKDKKDPINYEVFHEALYKGHSIKQDQTQFRCGKSVWLNEENPYQMTKKVVEDKTFKIQYSKGKVCPDGRVEPFVF